MLDSVRASVFTARLSLANPAAEVLSNLLCAENHSYRQGNPNPGASVVRERSLGVELRCGSSLLTLLTVET
jgi:hypothetical protein